jgi:hypothetical protein
MEKCFSCGDKVLDSKCDRYLCIKCRTISMVGLNDNERCIDDAVENFLSNKKYIIDEWNENDDMRIIYKPIILKKE